ncbi:glycosyltransferase [Actinomadura rudentiformis]|uniref:Glycosyltransferase family 1 protein n=1 Tax=Actinomadura rudentiformis TaxID=359158 RepID=A0A6H9YKU8_9ACTN|nr:glycosyltransferase [Actinomadura rudentiformis]KAB2339828.1 glycosyltransferase family 1 protein [Actinomadura rudentiformis]
MSRPLNIALVSASTLESDEVQSVHVRELARALGRPTPDGHADRQVTLHTRRDDEAARTRTRLSPGATLTQLKAGPPRLLSDDEVLPHVSELASGLHRRWSTPNGKPDLVHAHGWIAGLAATAAARDLDVPIVQSYHGLGMAERNAGKPVHPARIRMEKAIGRGADAVLAGCADEAEKLVRMGIPRTRIGITPYGVDGDQFTQLGPALPRGDLDRLVVLSTDLEDGGTATAIRSLVHIPNAELAITGGPVREELEGDAAVHRLRLLAKELGVDDRVIFLGGVPRKTLPRLLRTAKLALCLSPYGTSPLAPLEAMACGVPVVATPVGGSADSVLDGITGLHVPPGRPTAIGRAVRLLLSEETTLAGYSIAAADRAHSRYSWDRIAAETARAYTKIVERCHPVEYSDEWETSTT